MIVEFYLPSLKQPVRISLRLHSTAITIGTEPIYIFDPSGRLYQAFIDGRVYLRGLDGRIMEKWGRSQLGGSIRRDLLAAEGDRLLHFIWQTVDQICTGLCQGEYHWIGQHPPPGVQDLVQRTLATIHDWKPERLAANSAEFNRIYQPISILPPDQYLALVLQQTVGCSYNRCTFCTFYQHRHFHIKTAPEFEHHVRQVKSFFGQALQMRHTIFLADANAIITPQRILIPALDLVNREFNIVPPDVNVATYRSDHSPSFDGIYAFGDARCGQHKSITDFEELAHRNLRRVYIGLETGHDPLRRWVNKDGSSREVIDTVHTIKAGGLQVGIIILVGVGGQHFADQHVTGTIQTIAAMRLGAGDFVYLSEFVEPPGSAYHTRAQEDHILPLAPAQMQAQMARIRSGLQFDGPPPKISTYDIREFIY